MQPSREHQISRSLPPPTSPGPERQDSTAGSPTLSRTRTERHVKWSFLPWKLARLELSPPRRTRPLRNLLTTWDIRVRRYTSPRETWEVPHLLSPLLASPTRSDIRDTQTAQPAHVHRGTQASTPTPRVEQATQS
ncbi:protein cbr-spd-5, partial [Lasius niger]